MTRIDPLDSHSSINFRLDFFGTRELVALVAWRDLRSAFPERGNRRSSWWRCDQKIECIEELSRVYIMLLKKFVYNMYRLSQNISFFRRLFESSHQFVSKRDYSSPWVGKTSPPSAPHPPTNASRAHYAPRAYPSNIKGPSSSFLFNKFVNTNKKTKNIASPLSGLQVSWCESLDSGTRRMSLWNVSSSAWCSVVMCWARSWCWWTPPLRRVVGLSTGYQEEDSNVSSIEKRLWMPPGSMMCLLRIQRTRW
jgi:hypothetical protein